MDLPPNDPNNPNNQNPSENNDSPEAIWIFNSQDDEQKPVESDDDSTTTIPVINPNADQTLPQPPISDPNVPTVNKPLDDPDQVIKVPIIREDVAEISKESITSSSIKNESLLSTIFRPAKQSKSDLAYLGEGNMLAFKAFINRVKDRFRKSRQPSYKYNGKSSWNYRSKTALKIGSILGGFGIIGLVIAFMLTYVLITNVNDIKTPNQVSDLYYSDGSLMTQVIPPQGNRITVTYNQIPDNMKNAVIAAEDRNFWSNPGFSVTGYGRAVWKRLIGEYNDAGGGSTITQQFVKNAVVGDSHSLWRKWKELVYSIKLTHEVTKKDILTNYLNTIYFGRGTYGVALAAKVYFNKSLQDITLSEAALLAALVNSPSYLDPSVHLAASKARWNYVLDSMVETKAITKQVRDKQVFPNFIPYKANANNQSQGPLGLVKTQVVEELNSIGISENQLDTQGLKITTSINHKVQDAVTKAAEDKLNGEASDLRDAAVAIDPENGAVEGYFGGADGSGFDYAQAGLQTGSSFKVFALIAALEQNIPLSYRLSSAPLDVNGTHITNSDGETCGVCNIATALKMSLNTSYYRLMMKLKGGPEEVAKTAHEAGIAESFGNISHTLTNPNGSAPDGGVVLGQYLTRVFDMASAYATIADSGVYHQPYFITKVTDSKGKVLYTRNPNQGKQVFSPDVANNTIAAMEPIAAYSNQHQLAGGRPSGSKTGTTQLGNTSQNKDAWMIGFTPQLSMAVWVGTDKGKAIKMANGSNMYGAELPADIWQAAMNQSLSGTPIMNFPNPGPIAGQAGVPPEYSTKVVTPTITIGPFKISQPPVTVTVTTYPDGRTDENPKINQPPDQNKSTDNKTSTSDNKTSTSSSPKPPGR